MRDATPDELTRSTRVAANAAALAVVVFAFLWIVTTQVRAIREVSPFSDDPWDLTASYAAIFLPVVAGATWIRSVSHRGAILPQVTAARIRRGAGIALGIVLVSVISDMLALATTGPLTVAPGDVRPALIAVLVGAAGLAAVLALVLLGRAARVARAADTTGSERTTDTLEPDIVEDLLALAVDIARPVRLDRPIGRWSAAIGWSLDHSAASPRRHRLAFGVVIAIAAAIGFVVWHAVIEGGWASPAAMFVFGTLTAIGVLAIYLGTVVPLRLLRPVGRT